MAAEKIKPYKLTKRKPKVDKSKALNLRLTNKLSYKAIAALQGVTPQAIHNAIKGLLPTEAVKSYQQNRADILSGYQIKLLNQLDDERLKKMPAGSAVLAACQLYDKERLERNQSTANIATAHGITPEMQELYDKIVGRVKVESSANQGIELSTQAIDITSVDDKG